MLFTLFTSPVYDPLAGLRGLGLTFISTGLIAIAFMGPAGMELSF